LDGTQAVEATGAEARIARSVVMEAAMVFILIQFFGHIRFRIR
jgi:hypothetical protein